MPAISIMYSSLSLLLAVFFLVSSLTTVRIYHLITNIFSKLLIIFSLIYYALFSITNSISSFYEYEVLTHISYCNSLFRFAICIFLIFLFQNWTQSLKREQTPASGCGIFQMIIIILMIILPITEVLLSELFPDKESVLEIIDCFTLSASSCYVSVSLIIELRRVSQTDLTNHLHKQIVIFVLYCIIDIVVFLVYLVIFIISRVKNDRTSFLEFFASLIDEAILFFPICLDFLLLTYLPAEMPKESEVLSDSLIQMF